MKLRVSIIAMLALLALAPAARAGTTQLGLVGGLGFPIGDFGDAASLGFHLGGTGTYMVSDRFGFGGDIVWHSHGVDDEFEEALAAASGVSVDVTLSTLQFGAHGVYVLPSGPVVQPFLKYGVGIYNGTAKVEAGAQSSDESEADVGFNLGGGVHYRGSGAIGYGGEVLYHYIASDGDATTLITVSGKLTFGVGGQ